MDALWTLLGVALVALVLWDTWVTVLYPDADGPLATIVRRGAWQLATRAGALVPRARRALLVLAGPLLLVTTFVAWIGLLILGFSLIVWPMLAAFSSPEELGALTFVDAIYYAGGTVAVLGYGDIAPTATAGKVVSVAGAASGFSMFTAIATYMIEVVTGLATRNRFTLMADDETRGDGGANLLARCVTSEGIAEARQRCRIWADNLRAVDETMHRYPLVALTYRSRRGAYQPETALRRAAEVAAAAMLISGFEGRQGLRNAAEELTMALTRLQSTIADTYLTRQVRRRLSEPAPAEEDRAAVARLAADLAERVEAKGPATPRTEPRDVVELVFRSRVFLAGLSAWSRTEVGAHEWDK